MGSSGLTVTSSFSEPTTITTAANTGPFIPSIWIAHDCPVPWHTEDALRYDHLRTGCAACAPGWFLHLPSGAKPSWKRGIWA